MAYPVYTLLARAMRRFRTELYRVLQKVPTTAPMANVTAKLDNRTVSEVIAELNAIVTDHTGKLAQNIHKVTPVQAGTYAKKDIEDWAFELMGKDDRYPMSFYGDREYLPPDVSGSYGNATNPLPYSYVAMLLEDNGTLVMLRPGTDGASRDVYYAYMPNAMSNFTLSNWVATSVPYRPAFIPAGMKVHSILHSGRETIMGIVCNETTNVRTGYFVAITNGTFDQTKHSGIYIPNGQFLNVTFDITQNNAVASFLHGSHVYVLLSTFTSGTSYTRETAGFVVRRIPVADVLAGTWKSADTLSNWTINRGTGGQVARNDLILADNISSIYNLGSGGAYNAQNPRSSTESIWIYPAANGNPIVTVSYTLFFQNTQGTAYGNAAFVMSFELDPVSKIVDVGRYFNSRALVTAGASVVSIGASAAVSNVTPRQLLNGRKQASVHVAENNSVWVFDTSNDSNQSMKYTRLLYTSATPLDSILSLNATPNGTISIDAAATPGGPVGTNFCSLGVLSDSMISTLCFTKRAPANSAEWAWVRCQIDGSPTYAHSSATGDYAINGYPPTDNRFFLGTQGSGQAFMRTLTCNVAEVRGTSLVVHGGTFHYIGNSMAYWGTMLNRPSSIGPTGGGSGSVSIANATMQWIRQQITIYYDYLGFSPRSNGIMMSVCLPLLNTDCPPFVHGLFITDTGATSWFVFSLYLPPGMSRQNVPDSGEVRIMRPAMEPRPYDPPQYDPDTDEEILKEDDPLPYDQPEYYMDSPGSGGTHLNATYTPEFGAQTALRRSSSGAIVCVMTYPAFVSSTTGADGILHSFQYNPSGKSWNSREIVRFQPTGAPIAPLNFPNKGLMLAMSSEGLFGNIDYGSKLMARVWFSSGVPGIGLNAMVQLLAQKNNTQNTILVTQQVPNSWTLFFNRAQPVVLRGVSGTLPVGRHTFTASTDANKTFNVWACSDSPTSAPYYRVLPTEQLPFPLDPTETKYFLWLGTVTTNNIGVSSIRVGKPAALGPYVISQDKRGSAISYSAGVPAEENPLRWR